MRLMLLPLGVGVLSIVVPATLSQSAYHDDFNDNTMGPQWTYVVDAPGILELAEQNQRLEALSAGGGVPTNDALYLSNGPGGFRLSTASAFEIAIDYSFTNWQSPGSPGDAMALVFGIGRDEPGFDSAAIGMGYVNVLGLPVSGLAGRYRVNNVQSSFGDVPLISNTGKLVMSYDPATDTLLAGREGDPLLALPNVVQGQWNATDVLVSFGVRGSGFVLASGHAYFDNFEIRSGTIIPIPEPATAGLMVVGMGLLLRGRQMRPTSC